MTAHTARIRVFLKRLHAAPYLGPDPQDRIDSMSIDELADLFDSYPPGVSLRQRGNSFVPVQVPDLIGVRDAATWIAPASRSSDRSPT